MITDAECLILDIVATKLGCERARLSRTTYFVRDLDIDSLDAIEVQMAVEETFDIELPEEAVECVASIGDLIHAIEALWLDCEDERTV